MHPHPLPLLLLFLLLSPIFSKPTSQPQPKARANTFAILPGGTGVSAQQLFLGRGGKVYILDKTEGNVARVNGHSAWAVEYDLPTSSYRALDVTTNSFCAGGNQLGNGTWLNVGGNQAVTTGGIADWQSLPTPIIESTHSANGTITSGAYHDLSGGRATRSIDPCVDGTCEWEEEIDGIPVNRWYPSLETLEDGSIIIIGGNMNGSFVNSPDQSVSVPTYEFWPNRGPSVNSPFLQESQPANLYPLTWLLPNGQLFMQASWMTTLLNYQTGVETRLPNITRAQRTYPASAATAMLPLTPANNYTATLLFCGGMNPVRDDWSKTWAISETNTSSSCVSINPLDVSPVWKDEEDLPENRGMGNFIILPDSRLFLLNGVSKGSAGYGNTSWSINQSFAQDPVLRPAYYDPNAELGSRFSTNLPSSKIGRLYHSSATLLMDGSVFVAGSNPNADVVDEKNGGPDYVYKTEYRAEIFYPDYFDSGRPVPGGIPPSISYGGPSFDLTLPASSLNGTDLSTIKVALIRTGFSTHGMNMGMRYIQLENSFTGNPADGSATLHVSQLPPNPALFVPGPALLFVTVNGVPSIGVFTMVGSGILGTQTLLAVSQLPPSSSNIGSSSSSSPSSQNYPSNSKKPSASATSAFHSSTAFVFEMGAMVGLGFSLL